MDYFGLDGIRSVDAAYLCRVGYQLGRAMEGKTHVGVGMDNRPTSPQIAAAVCAGLQDAGVDVLFGGVMPTPCLQYATRHFVLDAGIMITASHNPAQYNGLKVCTADGLKPDVEQLQQLENALNNAPCCLREYLPPVNESVHKAYVRRFEQFGRLPLRIAVDCANGAAYPVVKHVFAQHGIEGVFIHHGEGKAVNRRCGALYPQDLTTITDVDFGVALDGDGDRCVLVTPTGRIVGGDGILYLLATHMAACDKLPQRTVVSTVMANGALQSALSARDIRLARSDVGDSRVWQTMNAEHSVLGGEPSGHILTRDGISDGIHTLLLLAQLAQTTSPDDALQAYTPLPQVMAQCPLSPINLSRAKAAADKWQEYLAGTGRIVVRASGTEPIVRIMVECEREQLAQTIAVSIAASAIKPKA